MISGKKVRSRADLKFLKSALSTAPPINSTEAVLAWIQRRNAEVFVQLDRIPFAEMRSWSLDSEKTRLSHNSGMFFAIEGINVQTNQGAVADWDQPIINQPEIGFLGIITKEIDGVLYFLLQAKIEPGNVNNVQLSPTLQATKSNYTKVHKGKSPAYLEYFTDRAPTTQILLDQLQSEQGARFLKKRNRNIIIQVEENLPVHEDFCWVTLRQIKELMRLDNVVNMDTRTVISGISYGGYSAEILSFLELMQGDVQSVGMQLLYSELNAEQALFSEQDIIHWFTELKTRYDLNIRSLPLHATRDWIIEDDAIRHREGKYFSVIGMRVQISSREVTSWDQPLVAPAQEGICAFVVKKINGILHFLVQAKVESGNFDILEMAPTVQCITGSYQNEHSRQNLPYLDFVLTAPKETFLYDTLQSEEGGRFYREQNRNSILLVGDDFPVETPPNYIWMTLHQLKTFIRFNNYLNIQARSLVAAVAFV